ncbi:MAG TPA: hypothetical protein VFA48_02550 [Gammaproteobacteria bacterium]|nr:hypothetical protein [Gammaproteobacteria bacterium]
MAVTEQAALCSGTDRSPVDAAAITPGWRLPAIADEVVSDIERDNSRRAYAGLWRENARSWSAVVEAGLRLGLIEPLSIIEAEQSNVAEKRACELVGTVLDAFARTTRERVQTWLARYGLSLVDRSHLVIGPQDWREDEQHRGLLWVRTSADEYYTFAHVPERMRLAFHVVVKRLLMRHMPRVLTDEMIDMGFGGEIVQEMGIVVEDCGRDPARVIETIEREMDESEIGSASTGMLIEELSYLDPAERRARIEMLFSYAMDKILADAEDKAVLSLDQAPLEAERAMRAWIASFERSDVSELERRWLAWFRAALVQLRFQALIEVHPQDNEAWLDAQDFIDCHPVGFTSLIDLDRTWVDEVVDATSNMVMQGGEDACTVFACDTADELICSLQTLAHWMLRDALIQAAVVLDDQ